MQQFSCCMETLITLTDELFQKIYSDPKFRNDITFAAKWIDKSNNVEQWHASSYPQNYIVTEEQITIAKDEREKANISIREKHKNDLLFKGMGSEFSPRWEDDITNHRIRTYFKNRHGRLFFIEILASNDKKLIVDCAQDIDAEKEFKAKQEAVNVEMQKYNRGDSEYFNLQKKKNDLWSEEPTCNYGGVRKLEDKYICTQSDIIRLVNEVFECDFKRMIIDEYNIKLVDDEALCQSPDSDYEVIIDEADFIESHRKKYPLPFDELTMYSSYDQVLGKTPNDYTPQQRFERWTKIMAQSELEIQEYFQDSEGCEGCVSLDQQNYWCKSYGLPCSYNPILKCLGMACGGAGKQVSPTQLTLF